MKKLLVFLLVVAAVWYFFLKDKDAVKLGSGVLAAEDPKQVKISAPVKFKFKDYTITPLASFYIKAKVLSRKNYRYGREAELSPVDLALGWGKMSDESVVDFIRISQSGRWYRWRVEEFPIPKREIETHSANMHIIPADKDIKKKLSRVRKGDIIKLKGSLVRVDAKDGWHWVSSLTRTDAGGHACEVIWVEKFRIEEF